MNCYYLLRAKRTRHELAEREADKGELLGAEGVRKGLARNPSRGGGRSAWATRVNINAHWRSGGGGGGGEGIEANRWVPREKKNRGRAALILPLPPTHTLAPLLQLFLLLAPPPAAVTEAPQEARQRGPTSGVAATSRKPAPSPSAGL